MRILVLSKRLYMGHDLLSDRYGRFFELPEELARRGHQVEGSTLAYHRRTREPARELMTETGVRWQSADAWPLLPLAWWRHGQRVRTLISDFRPEVILGCSDAFHCALAVRVGRAAGIPVVLDLYDQFESYAATRLPGVRGAFRHAVISAHGVACVSAPLAGWAAQLRGSTAGVTVLANAVNGQLFVSKDRAEARRRLELPPDALLVGTAGSLVRGRAIETLYQAFERVARGRNDIHLVVAGPRDRPPPSHPRIRDLQRLPHAEVPWLYAALDVGVVCNADSSFSRHCHPQKLVEMQACGLPAVVADTFAGTVAPEPGQLWLYAPGDAGDCARAISEAISGGIRKPIPDLSWAHRGIELEHLLQSVVPRTGDSLAGPAALSADTSGR